LIRLETVQFDFEVFDVTLFTFAEGALAGANEWLVSVVREAEGWGDKGGGQGTLLYFGLFVGFGRV
jgi:hypothetical protein